MRPGLAGDLFSFRRLLLEARDERHELVPAHADRAAHRVVRNRDPVFGKGADPRAPCASLLSTSVPSTSKITAAW
jgi:hypothetical protein